MKIIKLIFLCIIFSSLHAQKGDTVRTYLDDNLHFTTRENAV